MKARVRVTASAERYLCDLVLTLHSPHPTIYPTIPQTHTLPILPPSLSIFPPSPLTPPQVFALCDSEGGGTVEFEEFWQVIFPPQKLGDDDDEEEEEEEEEQQGEGEVGEKE